MTKRRAEHMDNQESVTKAAENLIAKGDLATAAEAAAAVVCRKWRNEGGDAWLVAMAMMGEYVAAMALADAKTDLEEAMAQAESLAQGDSREKEALWYAFSFAARELRRAALTWAVTRPLDGKQTEEFLELEAAWLRADDAAIKAAGAMNAAKEAEKMRTESN